MAVAAAMAWLFAAMDHAQAQSRTDYTGPSGGDWTNASYWSNGLPNGDGMLSSQRWAVIRQAAGQGPVISGGAEVSAYFLQVGLNDGSPGGLDDGSGALTLTGGSLLTTDAPSAIATGAGGSNQGVVNIDGSIWRAFSDITVGDTGDGSLTLTNGGRVESTFILAGNNAFSHGAISLSGNSTLVLSQGLVIGNSATASLTITGGSSVFNEEAFIDRYSTGGSTVMVDGGSWTNRSYLDMGALSSLTIRNGGSVSVGDGAGGDGTGRLSIHGGTITIGGYISTTLQAPGMLSASEVRADATSTIVFEHNSSSYVFSPDLSGAIALNVRSGTTILTGDFSSTYTGNTGGSAAYISNGTLQIGNGGTEGFANASVYVDHGALVFNRSDDIVSPMGIGGASTGIIRQNGTGKVTLTGYVGGTGDLNLVEVNGGDLVLAADMLFSPTKQGSGTLVIDGSTGTFAATGRYFSPTVLAGTLQFGDGAASAAVYPEGTIDLSGGNLVFNRLEDVNVGFNISSAGASGGQVRKRGANTLTLSGAAVDYSIPTIVEGGELIRDAGSASTTWYSPVSGAGALGKGGSGTLYLASALSQTGGTRIHEGTLYMSTGGSISGAITIDEGAWLRPSGVLSGDISGDGGLTVDGSATLFGSLSYAGPTNIAASTGSLTINPGNFASTLAGLVTNNGTLAVGSGSHAVTFLGGIVNNGVLNISGGPAVIGSAGTITGMGAISIAYGGTLKFDGGGGSRTIHASISGAGGLTVADNQLLTLDGGAAYTGPTTIGAATLEVVGSLSSSSVTMTASGYSQLAFSGSGSFAGNTTGPGTLTRNPGGSTTLYGNLNNNDPNGYTLYIDEGGEFVIGGSLPSTGDIYNGGSLVFDNSTPFVYGGGITGRDGSIVVKSGSQVGLLGSLGYSSLRIEGDAGSPGIVTLGTFNWLGSSSGQLILDGGKLVLPSSGGSIWSPIVLEDGGGSIESQALDSDFAWVQTGISGTGGLRKIGSGTLVLTATNTYTGGTTLQGGTIALGDSGDILPDTGSVTITSGTFKLGNADETIGSLGGTGGVIELFMGSGRTLTVNQSIDGTFSGILDGTDGRLVKDGPGMLTLAGTNTYTGGTTVKAGTLSFATDANLGDLSGTLTIDGGALRNTAPLITSRQVIIGENGATFENGGGYLTFTTPLSGPGGITRTGGGLLTLHGNQTYEGPTVISNGHFKVQDGSLASPSVSLAAGSNFYAINIGTYAGSITGSGNFQSDGTNTLAGVSTYTGTTVVTSGKLVVDGSIASSSLTTVAAGATLGGHGTVGDLVVAGTLSPGNSPGTLHAGNTEWNPGANYVFEINNAAGTAGTNWNLLDATGTLDLTSLTAGSFTIDITSLTLANVSGLATGFAPGTSYAFIIATASGGITGFDAGKFLIDTSAFFNDPANAGGFAIALSESSNSLILTYTAVPEPAEWGAIMAVALAGMLLLRRRNLSRR